MTHDARLFTYFVLVAEHLSFTAAARHMNVAQPWLSARIRQLEARLGFELFIRNTRHVALTDKGAALLPEARNICEATRRFEEVARQLGRQPSGLRIGVPPFLRRVRLASQMLDDFRQAEPCIPLEIEIGWSRVLQSDVASARLDAGFVLGARQDDAEFDCISLGASPLSVEMADDDPLAALPVIRPSDMAGRTLVVFTRANNPKLFDELFGNIRAAGATLVEEEGPWSPSVAAAMRPGALGMRLAVGSRGERGRVARPVAGGGVAHLSLIRRKGAGGPGLSTLWRFAEAATAGVPA